MSETRKLAAIVCSDVVGYSRLAGADEDRVLAHLRAPLSDLIDPTIRSPSQAHGRRLDRRILRRRRRRSLRQRSSDRHSRTQRRCAPECRPSDAYWLSHQYSSERPGGGKRCRPMGDGVNIAAYTFLDPGRIVCVGVAGAAFSRRTPAAIVRAINKPLDFRCRR
jgi:hypothetical protein